MITSCSIETEADDRKDKDTSIKIIQDSNQYILFHNSLKKGAFEIDKCNLLNPVTNDFDTILTVRDCDSLYIYNKKEMKLYPFELKTKSISLNDTLIKFNNYLIYGLYDSFFVITENYELFTNETKMIKKINDSISTIPIEDIMNGYNGLSRLSEHTLKINLTITTDSSLVCEYEFYDFIGLTEYYYDTICLKK